MNCITIHRNLCHICTTLSVEPTGVKYALSNEYPFGAFVSVIEIVPNGSVGKPSTKRNHRQTPYMLP